MAATVKSVDDFLGALEPEPRAQVEDLRRIILALRPPVTEHIKWNSPSYVHDGIDRITVNTRNKAGAVQLILHFDTARPEDRAAPPLMPDDTGLIRWLSDIRGVITLPPGTSAASLEPALSVTLTRWLALP